MLEPSISLHLNSRFVLAARAPKFINNNNNNNSNNNYYYYYYDYYYYYYYFTRSRGPSKVTGFLYEFL